MTRTGSPPIREVVELYKERKKKQEELLKRFLPLSFLHTSAQMLENLGRALKYLTEDLTRKDTLTEIRFLLHKLTGSGGTYGFNSISDIARRGEDVVTRIEQGEIPLLPDTLATLMEDVDEMERIVKDGIARLQSEEPPAEELPTPARDETERPRPKVLCVDDDEDINNLVSRYMQRAGYEMETAVSGEEAMQKLVEFSPDMILLDIQLPDIDGVELMIKMRNRSMSRLVPIVFITSRTDIGDRVRGLTTGGDDYITKPFYPEELVARVGALLERINIMKELAEKDGLTGLFNHRHFQERLREEISRWKRHGRVFSLALLDLDYFKRINDTRGHLVGDHVLREIASFLRRQLRNMDVVCRYGGEEFTIIFPETADNEASIVMKRLYDRARHWALRVPKLEEPIKITFSAGIVTCPEDGDDPEVLISRADRAMYLAKKLGRNRYIHYRNIEKLRLEENAGKAVTGQER